MAVYDKMFNEDASCVAVLYSPGFGAGWSSWANEDMGEQLAMDKRLVQAALDDVKDIDPLVEEIFGDKYVCTLGWSNIQVEWLPVGVQFQIREYDGAESVVSARQMYLYTA